VAGFRREARPASIPCGCCRGAGHFVRSLAQWMGIVPACRPPEATEPDQLSCRGVAQPGSALALGARGPGFESPRPDQQRSFSDSYKRQFPTGQPVGNKREQATNRRHAFDRTLNAERPTHCGLIPVFSIQFACGIKLFWPLQKPRRPDLLRGGQEGKTTFLAEASNSIPARWYRHVRSPREGFGYGFLGSAICWIAMPNCTEYWASRAD
jgi:hypothetical protein